MVKSGILYGVGLGPGDPELITLKALRVIESCDVIAYHQARGKPSNALNIVKQYLRPHQQHLPLIYPLTTENVSAQEYEKALAHFYRTIAAQIACLLDDGKRVSVMTAGDPMLYSSFMHIYDRLHNRYETIIIPGVTSISGAAAALGCPLCYHNQNFTILSALEDEATLTQKMLQADAFAIIKLGRNFAKIRRILHEIGLAKRAHYIERATMLRQKIIALDDVKSEEAPYFSMIIVAGKREGQF